ncbi:MAG: LytTR family DNA-binding domain-containing protein [Lachnospiraceae bacterium]|nr:LytTR family DNA-binding domain-containing protein [Lachnospiraceae bacterium]
MLRVAICDDSEFMRNETKKCLLKYGVQKNLDYTVKLFENGETMLQTVNDFDLVFLDYEFEDKGADGLTIAKAVRKENKDIMIIFLSSYPNVVFQSFEVGTFRFLVKPIEEDKFFQAMDDLLKQYETDEVLTVKLDGMNYFIQGKQISYIEGDGKNCIIHFIDKADTLEVHETLSAIEGRLSEKIFFRCHKSFLVNLCYVASYNHTDLFLENEEALMISRQKYKPFTEAYGCFLAEQKGI